MSFTILAVCVYKIFTEIDNLPSIMFENLLL